MNIDVKIINKILVDQIQQHTKMSINHDQVGFIPRKQGCSSIQKPNNVNCHVKKKKKKKDENHRIISTDAEKNSCQELASFYNKRKILIKGELKEIP